MPSIDVADALLDEHRELTGLPRLNQMPRAALRGTTRKRRVAVDTAGNVYVTDGNHNRVLKFPAG